ncbi:MAG: hypothetical protein V4726_22235 [Verrucomicrobiota bacterium]
MTQVAIQLPDELKVFVDRSVKSGLFSDVSDFVVNLLYNVKAQSEIELDEDSRAKLAVLRSEIAVGVAQAERGDFVDFTAGDIIAEAHARRAHSA